MQHTEVGSMVEPDQSATASSLCNLSAMKDVGEQQQHNVLFPDFATCLKNIRPPQRNKSPSCN
jgi:hypothetical protein